ncbi:MAG TPA: bifunctional aspartate kinase/homoserine dehydrogenase I [Candidatus Ozemobacteraceae bacterium]|nr:bifunctional aspartate kinase/homoserine dehydrogenase I [Candidatus Ozemobacteraceae bacterium]
MKVMKFGGTSVGDADRLRNVARLVAAAAVREPVGLVISAMTGITNHLIDSVTAVLAGKDPLSFVQVFEGRHQQALQFLQGSVSDFPLEKLQRELSAHVDEFSSLLNGVRLVDECSARTLDRISCLGERALIPAMAALLQAEGLSVKVIDPRVMVLTDSVFGNASPLMDEIERRFASERDLHPREVLLMPGFFGGDRRGHYTTLGRGGSDYSAAILAAALHADTLEIWTDVDGVYTADPRVVPDAFVLEEMTYTEAMELAFFGAKVLHPRTIAPVVERSIPVIIRNTFRPDHPGTRVARTTTAGKHAIRGLSSLGAVAMIGLSGAGLRGVPGVAARVFSAMAHAGISVILIAQASSEYSICFCVSEGRAPDARETLEEEFRVERQAGLVDPIEVVPSLAVISAVGEEMRSRRGLAGAFFGGLATADVNVVAIAQGFSERNISAVIAGADTQRAMRAAHQSFFNTTQGIQVFLVGVGAVGRELVQQIETQQASLRQQGIDLRLCGVADSRHMAINLEGYKSGAWQKALLESSTATDLRQLASIVQDARLMNPVLVDATGSDKIASAYLPLLESGMHVVTPNKLANAGSWDYYLALRQTANRRRRHFLYGTNVGAGLPIIDTLRNLRRSGDRLRACSGILSGSLSFLMGRLEDGVPFSQVLHEARDRGFTEPDPRQDLSGMDVARKILILAREAGLRRELAEIRLESILPAGSLTDEPVEAFLARAPDLDAHFSRLTAEAKRENKVWRFAGRIETDGSCHVGPIAVTHDHPLAAVRDGENAVSLLTDRYSPIPLVVRGYGAGPAVTAAGVFADLMRTVIWHTEGVLS